MAWVDVTGPSYWSSGLYYGSVDDSTPTYLWNGAFWGHDPGPRSGWAVLIPTPALVDLVGASDPYLRVSCVPTLSVCQGSEDPYYQLAYAGLDFYYPGDLCFIASVEAHVIQPGVGDRIRSGTWLMASTGNTFSSLDVYPWPITKIELSIDGPSPSTFWTDFRNCKEGAL